MIKLQKGERFKLPRVGTETFSKLMRAKLKYDKKNGLFEITEETDLTSIISILSNALDEQIIIEIQCVLCLRSAGCEECEYAEICDISKINKCICKECLAKPSSYDNYKELLLQKLKFD